LHHLIGFICEPIFSFDFNLIDVVTEGGGFDAFGHTAFSGTILHVKPFVFLGDPVESLLSPFDKDVVVKEKMG
jgi:hypothetical protein